MSMKSKTEVSYSSLIKNSFAHDVKWPSREPPKSNPRLGHFYKLIKLIREYLTAIFLLDHGFTYMNSFPLATVIN